MKLLCKRKFINWILKPLLQTGMVLMKWAGMKSDGFKKVLTQLYLLLIWSDGEVNDKEVLYGRKMARVVGIDEAVLAAQTENLAREPSPEQFNLTIMNLKTLSREDQIQCIAWLCIIANADGFMDKTEWQLIYRIYYKELRLSLEEIMKMQKHLSQQMFMPATSKMSVL